MAAKGFLVLCASALLVKTISSQCVGAGHNNIGWSGPSYGLGGCGSVSMTPPTSGGGLAVISSSPIAPSGLKVISENIIDGSLAVTGNLPVLAAVAVEGPLPTSGTVATTYSCGNSNVGITSEAGRPYGAGAPYGVGPAGLVSDFAGPMAGPGVVAGSAYTSVPNDQVTIGPGCDGIYW